MQRAGLLISCDIFLQISYFFLPFRLNLIGLSLEDKEYRL